MWSLINPYAWAIFLRNAGYNAGVFSGQKAVLPTVVVGNITSGGSGKTPTAAWLLDLLVKNGMKPAFLSRGYGRETSGMVWVSEKDTPKRVGDEPALIKQIFSDLPVLCSADRLAGAAEIKNAFPDTDVVVLDDGFQHRKLKADVNLILVLPLVGRKRRELLPFGKLREPLGSLARADAVLVTKAANFEEFETTKEKILQIKDVPVWNAPAVHELPEGITEHSSVCLVTGIAEPEPLCAFLREKGVLFQHLKFSDHHVFTKNEVQEIQKLREKGVEILTTAKDQVRLKAAGITFARTIEYRLSIPEETGEWILTKLKFYVEHYREGKRIHS